MNPSIEPYFDDPRLRMTFVGRLFARAVTWIFYLVLAVGTFLFLLSDIARARWMGVGLLLFLLDRARHRGEADVPLSELNLNTPFSILARGGFGFGKKAGSDQSATAPSSVKATGVARVNVAKTMRPAVANIIERAFDRSILSRCDFFLEVVRKMSETVNVREALVRLDVKPDEFRHKLEALIAESVAPAPVTRADCLEKADMLAVRALYEAFANGHDFIEMDDLFSAAARAGDPITDRLFAVFSIEAGDLSRALILSSAARRSLPGFLGGFASLTHHRRPHRVINRAWTSRPTPLLDKFSDDLTDLAREEQVGFLIGHDEEFTRLMETLARPVNPNAILVGEAGIGKEAIIQHLAFRLTRDDVPQSLFDRRLVALGLSTLIAGATPEDLQKRLQEIVGEIITAGNIILYIPDIHNLVRTSGTAYLSSADALAPVITSNAFPIIGTSFPREFKQLLEPRSDFTGAFEIIPVNEISVGDAEKLLTYESVLLEREYRVTVSFGAVKRAVVLAKKYVRNKFLPSSAEELLKSALVDAKARGEKSLGPDRVTAVTEAKVNIPIHEAGGAEAEALLHLEDTIHERLVDQEEAVKAVSQALREYRSGIARQGGPIASFLFVGPTGVGKTELAKILTKVQFGSEKNMVRFDMTEYQDKQSFFRLIGSPDGATRGALTDAIIAQPYCLILLDEFEKAFPDILNLFLQVLDDGRLTDNMGRTVDFTNTIIIATSNAHSDIINESLSKGESMASIAEYLKSRLTDVFKPELINRFSKIIVFKDLAPDDLRKIVLINLNELAETVKGQGMAMEFDPAAVTKISQLGFDPKFGARPLRRVIDEKLRAPLSEAILSKTITRGSRIKLTVNGEEFSFINE